MTFFFSSKKNETVPNFTSILDYMKYKKIIELLPAYTLFIFLLSSNSACSNGQASNKQTEDTVTDTITRRLSGTSLLEACKLCRYQLHTSPRSDGAGLGEFY